MTVRCDFYGPLRDAVGTKSLERDVSPEATVGDLLRELTEAYPELEDLLFSDGDLRETVFVTRNGQNVRLADGLRTPVEDGDVIRASPPVEGGRTAE